MKRRNWVAIAFGVVFVLVILGIIGLGLGVYVFFRHVGFDAMSPEAAARQMERERARFGGQEPLFLIDGDEVSINERARQAAPPSSATLKSIRVLTFETNEDRLVRIDVPFWLFRMGGSAEVLDGVFKGGDLQLTPQELEALGPALLVDHEEPDGTRVLVWTE